MKQTRLLEIIREEIASALTEITVVDKKTDSTEAPEIAKKEEKDLSTVQNAIKTAKTTGKPISIAEEEKRKKLAEKYQLDEETINEMASIKQTIDGLKALGDERNEIVAKVAQDTLNQFKKNPAIASGGRLTRELEPNEYPNKKDRKISYSTEFLKNYKEETGEDFNTLTFDIESRWEKEKPGEKLPFKSPGLAANTTDKDAANQILGKIPSPKGPKPKAEPKAKSEKAPKAKPAAAPKAEPMDDEDAEAAKAAGSDEMAKKLASTPDSKKQTFNRILNLVTKYKDDKAKVDAFITKAEKEYKLPSSLVKDLKRAAGREVEA